MTVCSLLFTLCLQVYSGAHGRAMIFTSTKKEANELALNSVLKQETQVLHGDINQTQREITLSSFREGKIRVLVATDVASRGLDIPEVDLVIQTEPPAVSRSSFFTVPCRTFCMFQLYFLLLY